MNIKIKFMCMLVKKGNCPVKGAITKQARLVISTTIKLFTPKRGHTSVLYVTRLSSGRVILRTTCWGIMQKSYLNAINANIQPFATVVSRVIIFCTAKISCAVVSTVENLSLDHVISSDT